MASHVAESLHMSEMTPNTQIWARHIENVLKGLTVPSRAKLLFMFL